MGNNTHGFFVPTLLACEDCGLTLLGFESRGPTPINHEECPRCGCSEFAFETDGDE